MPEAKPLTGIISDLDTWTRHALGTTVIEAGFDVVAEGANVLDALREAAYLRPAVVVLTQDSIGMNPIEIISELREGDRPPEIVLVTHDVSVRDRARAAGAYAVAESGDADQLLVVLAEVRELVETGERRRSTDRRTGQDRRVKQEWSKVTTQRRAGIERRQQPRRQSDALGNN